ncbi:protein kinase [Streptomyces sp. NPDC006530]|uniref:serine/threonine-protein kinase n=1 Tax=Streptomyces sp. NPDC006530 TaxID=3364750 RepID=UPI003680047C
MGEVFAGRYELIDPVGRGGAGAVWRAWDRRRRRYVAAKVLQQSDAHTLLRFVREQALRIDHPHVLAPASWAADDDKVLFTMDLVSGGSLAHLIGDYGPLPPRFVCTLLDQLLAGLAAVHAEGVVHRDIKPANILLEATGSGRPHLRLSDFGISLRKDEPRLTETNYVVGTPGYFAPEQMMGAEPDFPADLFAVGLVALYLLEGSKPDARALVEYFTAHGTPGAPQGIPEPLWQVLAGLLQPNPQNRFRTATGARKALASAVELLPDPDPDEEPVEVFDQIGPLPPGCTDQGPTQPPRRPEPSASGRDGGPPFGPGAYGGEAYETGVRGGETYGSGVRGGEAYGSGAYGQGADDSGAYASGAYASGASGMSAVGPPVSGSPQGPAGESRPGEGQAMEGGSVQGGSVQGRSVEGRPELGRPIPGQPLPGQPWPGQSTPGQSTPGQWGASSVVGNSVAGGPLPGQPGPGQWAASDSVAGHLLPDPAARATPGHAAPTPAPTPAPAPAPAPAPHSFGTGPFPPAPQQPPTPPTQAPPPTAPAAPYAAQHYDRTPPTPATTPYTTPYPYAAEAPQVPLQSSSFGSSVAQPQSQSAPQPQPQLTPRPRSGPPAKVAVPVLLIALVCFAVGIWALTQM